MSTSKSVQPADRVADAEVGPEQSTGLDDVVQGVLGRKLRESYDDVVNETVPDRFLQLLNQLRSSEKGGSTDSTGGSKG